MGLLAEARFEACIDSLYATLVNPVGMPGAMDHIKGLVDATAMAFIRADAQTNVTRFVVSGYDPSLPEVFVRHYASLDPGKAPLLDGRAGEWMQDDDAFDERYTLFPEYVVDFAPLAGIRWFRGTKLYDRAEGGASVVSVVRPADARPFDADDMACLQRLYPHLARLSRLQDDMEALAPTGAASEAAAEMLGTGVCVVDAGLRIVYANRSALDMLRGDGPLRGHANVLSGRRPAVQARLAQAVALAIETPRQARSFCANPDEVVRQRMQVRVLPVDEASSLARAPGGPFAMLFIACGTTQLRADELGQLFGLTPSEAGLVSLLAQGLSPAACADRRHVSISTVRTQLKWIYAKTGVGSHAQLMTLVLALPGLSPPG